VTRPARICSPLREESIMDKRIDKKGRAWLDITSSNKDGVYSLWLFLQDEVTESQEAMMVAQIAELCKAMFDVRKDS
jgi:hypothetical protein